MDLIDVNKGKQYSIQLESKGISEADLAFNHNGTLLAAVDRDSNNKLRLTIWDMNTGRLRIQVSKSYLNVKPSGISFNSFNNIIAIGLSNGEILLLDSENGSELKMLRGHSDGGVRVQFSPDGKRLLSCGIDRTIRLWDWDIGKELISFEQDWYAIDARFSPDGFSIANTDLNPIAAWIRIVMPVETNPRNTYLRDSDTKLPDINKSASD